MTERRTVDELSVAEVSVLGGPEQTTELEVPLRPRVGSFTTVRLDNRVEFSGPVDARVAFVPDDAETAAGAEDAMELGDGQGDVKPVERLGRHDGVGGGGLERKRFGHAGERDDGQQEGGEGRPHRVDGLHYGRATGADSQRHAQPKQPERDCERAGQDGRPGYHQRPAPLLELPDATPAGCQPEDLEQRHQYHHHRG